MQFLPISKHLSQSPE